MDSLIYSQGITKAKGGDRNAKKAVSVRPMSSYMHGELLLAADAFLAGVFWQSVMIFSVFSETLQITASFWIGIEDILYWCVSGIYLFNLIYRENDGMIRIYVLLFTGLGALLYHAGPSMILVKYISAILRKIGKVPGNYGNTY